MANTKRIIQTKVNKLWDFPPLSDGKQGRIITKHYCNLIYSLNHNHAALLSYLVYQSQADNTILYSEGLLRNYAKSVRAARGFYSLEENGLSLSIPKCRDHFEYLISNGLLLPTSEEKRFLINPCLTFSKVYVKAEFYKEWVNLYQNAAGTWKPNILAAKYINHIDQNFKSRGKRKNKR